MQLALFDLDHTLLDVDSDYLWGEFLIRQGLVDKATFRAQNNTFYEQYVAGTLDAVAYTEFVAGFLSKHTLTDLYRWRDDYILHDIKPKIRPKAQATLQKHLDANHEVVIISATNDFIVNSIALLFGIPESHVIATTLAVNDAGYTGKLVGTPNFHTGKLTNLNHWLANKPDISDSWGYSDSFNDLPLLTFCKNAYAVTPDDKLKAKAIENGWDILDWSI